MPSSFTGDRQNFLLRGKDRQVHVKIKRGVSPVSSGGRFWPTSGREAGRLQWSWERPTCAPSSRGCRTIIKETICKNRKVGRSGRLSLKLNCSILQTFPYANTSYVPRCKIKPCNVMQSCSLGRAIFMRSHDCFWPGLDSCCLDRVTGYDSDGDCRWGNNCFFYSPSPMRTFMESFISRGFNS